MNHSSATVLKKSKSNFALAFLGLARDQRKAMEAIYAYCRTVDDIVDESHNVQKAETELGFWKSAIAAWPYFSSVLPIQVARDLEWAVQRFPIQKSDILWILEGVEKDLRPAKFRTLEELLVYCDGVASAVGFCCMSIFDVNRVHAQAYVLATGRALQLTNILRDIASDAKRDRVYLPQNFLDAHQVTQEDLKQSNYGKPFLSLAQDFAKKIDEFYVQSELEARKLSLKKIWPAEVMRKTYLGIFKRIQEEKYDVFTQKIKLGKLKKLWIALSQPRG